MKKIFSNNRLIAIALLTVFSLTISPAIQANDTKPTIPVELKYLGTVKEHAVFQLNFFGNKEENMVKVSIIDINGNALFSENIKGETFSKKFLLNTDQMIETPLRFEITSKSSKEKVVFEINRYFRTVEEMVINTKN